ncbi:MAG: hypothetical protein COV74_09375 [Candidatus Omnitrophica bacterium CG11_big_fil_rev_8_21_14_0_20_45_26]|uniref:ACT domain-containing protein n=1 Tax=Candidatus Abzuiibacterium crystallinum TaxID=1974748 RepID=A0A2H0LLL0_9BACT|nr:MAG: hypothetical protein COV74_09375 [Candidatus Omnitrophica bacterium CG11_big_fil_rev_8_21_14_0_20_45_26]PIW65774.1 MAG: hypothetical protein COW12_00100 [Candidatus Omnitrophica bacterium CG12_big_fil_rev_8_21_14_0_65_45_16]
MTKPIDPALPKAYLARCPAALHQAQSESLCRLDAGSAFEMQIKHGTAETMVGLVCHDFLGLLSIVSGLLSSYGFNIREGCTWTLEKNNKGKAYVASFFIVESKSTIDWQAFEKELRYFLEKSKKGNLKALFQEMNAKIVNYFRTHEETYLEKLYPVQLAIDQNRSDRETVATITSQDTFAFLYELTSALSLIGMNITAIQIDTQAGVVHDQIWVTTTEGQKVTDAKQLKALRWAILLIKQFTHLVSQVPDPQVALDQAILFGKEIIEREDFDQAVLSLEGAGTLEGLSRIFGSSRFFWEEFLRTQHQSLIPLIGDQAILRKRKSKKILKEALAKRLSEAKRFDEKVELLNQFKDQEMFRIDMRHLLQQTSYLEEFAEEFTDLAEVVVAAGCGLCWEKLLETAAHPLTEKGTKSRLAVVGLGKFGGRELGYASDLELLFVYEDIADSAAVQSQKNFDFYEAFVRLFRSVIWARREGVFEIDLRLRPHGDTGPLAVSEHLFKRYYAGTGDAWSYERQALVKLRLIAGDSDFGREVEKWRDQYVYGGQAYNLAEARHLRERQRTELTAPETLNVKYSKGGLLDIEYLVQTLQIIFGQAHSALRLPNTLQALRQIWQTGILKESEFQALRAAYIFIRELINALRIFRGNAKDLALPKRDVLEFSVLARRMHYEGTDEEVREALHRACEHHMKTAFEFYDAWMARLASQKWEEVTRLKLEPVHLNRPSLDELLRGDLSDNSKEALLASGFDDLDEVIHCMKHLYPGATAFEPFAKAFDTLWPIWQQIPDPNLALRHLERLSGLSEDRLALWNLLNQKADGAVHLLRLFGSSEYLADMVITHPGKLAWVLEPGTHDLKLTQENLSRLSAEKIAKETSAQETQMENWRQFRQAETLRIALVELRQLTPLQKIHASFSDVADCLLNKVYQTCLPGMPCGVAGLGKLGGRELNFSSDVDLMFISKEEDPQLASRLQTYVNRVAKTSVEGFLYRIDLRLRPHGEGGSLVMSADHARHYYQNTAEPWEFQMLIKARPVAGDLSMMSSFLASVQPLILGKSWTDEEFEFLRKVKRRYEQETKERGESHSNIKLGLGGIRDVEFAVQAVQLRSAHKHPSLKQANTFQLIDELDRLHLLPEDDCQTLKKTYELVRRIENWVQLYHNRQYFLVPSQAKNLRRLARTLGFQDQGQEKAEDIFERDRKKWMGKTREIFERIFY